MRHTVAFTIYNKISNKLLNLDFIQGDQALLSHTKETLQTPYFTNNIETLMTGKDFDCQSILNLCKDLIMPFSKGISSEDLCPIIYQYTLSKSFPRSVEITLTKDFEKMSIIYLEVLRILLNYKKNAQKKDIPYPFEFLTPEEEKKLRNPNEYKRFKHIFYSEYVYEMMVLHQDITGHNTLDHISGVHFVALNIGRQLLKAGLPVDLGRVSGAAAGHDIGKYGCKGPDLKRVPYLHYYYTDLWFKHHNIPYIGHIATNHSTWDLELENLPLESLILIYSDFRVKNKRLGPNKRAMHIFSLEESFNIILSKLDNVDEAKEKRYRRVYAKLRDFEDFMIDLGIHTDLSSTSPKNRDKKYHALMGHGEIIDQFKHLSINHNIHLMHKLRSDASLSSILELARSENDWKNLRAYLQTFEEYSTYLTQRQKIITLNFLYELLTHREEDIRKQAAELIGALIAMYNEEYRKEVPQGAVVEASNMTSYQLLDDYVTKFLYPDHKIIERHRQWIGYSLKAMVASLFAHARKEEKPGFRKVLLTYYGRAIAEDYDVQFYLLQITRYIPHAQDDDKHLKELYRFVLEMLNSPHEDIRLSALERIYSYLSRSKKEGFFVDQLRDLFNKKVEASDLAAENFLKYKISEVLNLLPSTVAIYEDVYQKDHEKMADIFLKNLKSATSWIYKKIHIELLLGEVIKSPEKKGLHTAMHFCNLLKVSSIENVRNHAGDALLTMFPFLSMDQRNDVTIELLRALEIQGYHFTKYIPYYLGQLSLYLQPVELDELLDDFIDKIKEGNTQINTLIFKTIGYTIDSYPNYENLFEEPPGKYEERLKRMLGILLNGLASPEPQIKQEAFSVIGSKIFNSKNLTLEQKHVIFKYIAKKMLTLLPDMDENTLVLMTNSAALKHIYQFISDFIFFKGPISLNSREKIAFFPGSFDPFSLSHKEIAREIRDMGFEVYLAVDEFSWSKRTQPHNLRRHIISMSIADELNIHLYPEDLPVNIANPRDLEKLKHTFDGLDLYIVVGSDVVINASSYKLDPTSYSIHNLNHIIFERRNLLSSDDDEVKLEKVLASIKAKKIRLALSPRYEDISSTQIRNNIDENRDISQLLDPMAQKYIYNQGIYRREPQYKTIVQTKSLDIRVSDVISEDLIQEVNEAFFLGDQDTLEKLRDVQTKLSPRAVIIRDMTNRKILGFSLFHWVRSSMLYHEFKNNKISEHIRENAVGRMIVIDGIFTDRRVEDSFKQVLLTETLAFSIAKDYTYAIYKDVFKKYASPSLYDFLRLQGFTPIPFSDQRYPIFVVDMSSPCTLNLDLEPMIKEPFRSHPSVQRVVRHTRKKLQKAMTHLYPGQLILSFDRDIVYENLVERICKLNDMPPWQLQPRQLGDYMCAPFGSILKGEIVPNTVTKSLHTEKMFRPDIKGFNIGPYPNYMSLDNQIKMLRSFNRPVILIDDLLNKGYRIKAIDPLLKKTGVEVKKIIVGILSGRGKELMDLQNREVDSAYFIPNLKVWFNENTLYPFIGGDTVWRGYIPQRNLLPSINFILPYASPAFIKGTTNEALYHLSETCILNAINILSTLEKVYQNIHERNLTLKHLGEVFISPRCPDHGKNIDYDLNRRPSQYLKNDLEHLRRIENIIKRRGIGNKY